MKTNIFFIFNSFLMAYSFTLQRNILKMQNNDNLGNNNDDLGNIENHLLRLSEEMKRLKKNKFNILSNTKGYKAANHSQNKLYNDSYNNFDDFDIDSDESESMYYNPFGLRIIYKRNDDSPNNNNYNNYKNSNYNNDNKNSENFEIIKNTSLTFKDVGGYENIKEELLQCSDLLLNYEKYSKYNVRTPKGLILEGPPGNGKTLLAKSFCGEIQVNFIPVSGAQFQEKYVGVGASRVRELFKFALDNKPCIIYIDEIDAVGRKRSGDGESHTTERDSTLNELLVGLDGFKSTNGIFLMGSTNRIDLLDEALIRPGRIDKKIYVGNPDKKTREFIMNIHIKGKPYEKNINIETLVEMTNGFSGAQIENLLNEAMLYTLRSNRDIMKMEDLEIIINRILVGWQSTPNHLSSELLRQVAIHEMGHAIVGLLTNYKKLIKVTINLWSPNSLGFTLFETNEDEKSLITKDKLITELMVLLGGRIAEELFYPDNISSGASHDLDICKSVAENMIIKYGMGTKNIIPSLSDKNKEIIDNEITELINLSYNKAKRILTSSKKLIEECSQILIDDHILTTETIIKKINNKYSYLMNL